MYIIGKTEEKDLFRIVTVKEIMINTKYRRFIIVLILIACVFTEYAFSKKLNIDISNANVIGLKYLSFKTQAGDYVRKNRKEFDRLFHPQFRGYESCGKEYAQYIIADIDFVSSKRINDIIFITYKLRSIARIDYVNLLVEKNTNIFFEFQFKKHEGNWLLYNAESQRVPFDSFNAIYMVYNSMDYLYDDALIERVNPSKEVRARYKKQKMIFEALKKMKNKLLLKNQKKK